MNFGKELTEFFWGVREINNKCLQKKGNQFIKTTNWILPHILQETTISEASTFYTDAKKVGKEGYKSGNLNKLA